MSPIRDLRDLLSQELQAMYSAEKLITKSLPRMMAEARRHELKQAFELHLREYTS